ncbi:4-hydroxybenzoate polyprenyltransferase [Loktanella ponticola]|uniref:4-hydroxybenzoate polyprenyltransferase n=1 Tax=Yoonia ponticola TaxID=1524255 RepID=A0A7W9EYS5_9RHOB|nr:UbiA family prenyltransferase [Yoonia ponticola]MBB5723128.1 4-hydroxybenzoate polyprenyltransferase [Yoonia ponticola]
MTVSRASRIWTYQSERFPLKKTAPLLAVFSAASICASATLSGRDIPSIDAFITGFIVAMALFFQVRVCDEIKDYDDDLNFRPERPIPRGLVSLQGVVRFGLLTIPPAIIAVWAWHAPVLWLLFLVWLWLTAMTFEFGVPALLKARPVLYLASHMAIMPLIDLLLTGIEWVPGGGASPHLWMFIALSFVNGCVLEIGRKLWAPENEITGVETYSGLWGVRKASLIWMLCLVVSFGLLCGIGAVTRTLWIVGPLGLIAGAVCILRVLHYRSHPTPKAQADMDTIAGLWVFVCYAIAGFVPVVLRAL